MEGGGAIRPDHHTRVQDMEERQSGDDRDLRQDVPGTNEPLSHKEPDFRSGGTKGVLMGRFHL